MADRQMRGLLAEVVPMVVVAPLDVLGVTPEFFHLPPVVAGYATLDYYLVGAKNPHRIAQNPRALLQESCWDLIVVGTLPHDPNSLMLRQIHIEEEQQESTEFDAWADGRGTFTLNPPEVVALRDFFLHLADRLPAAVPVGRPHPYFETVRVAAYADCGIPADLVDRFRLLLERDTRRYRLYRYRADTTISPVEACRFLQLSDWTSPWSVHPLPPTLRFRFQTYTPVRIAAIQDAYTRFVCDPATITDIADESVEGESTIHLSRGALRAVAALLAERLDIFALNSTPDTFPSSAE